MLHKGDVSSSYNPRHHQHYQFMGLEEGKLLIATIEVVNEGLIAGMPHRHGNSVVYESKEDNSRRVKEECFRTCKTWHRRALTFYWCCRSFTRADSPIVGF